MAGIATPVEEPKMEHSKEPKQAHKAGKGHPDLTPSATSRRSRSTVAADEELATRLRVAVTRLNRRLRHESLAGLSPAQASVLGTIYRLGTPTLGELAVDEQVQPPTMTRLVGSLESAGLVDRHPDADDRRVVRVKVTAEGRRCLERVRTLKTAFLSRGLAGLGPEARAEVVELTALLERLVGER